MLGLYGRSLLKHVRVIENLVRCNSTENGYKFKTSKVTKDNTTFVTMEKVEDPAGNRQENEMCSLCTCNVPVKVTYKDVLILEQFMREDGTVLPRQLTGLCKTQQLRVERCVMQAFWSGLFGDKFGNESDRAGYKRFNRYWKNDMSMYQLEKKERDGTWYYIKRYPTKNQAIFKNPLN